MKKLFFIARLSVIGILLSGVFTACSPKLTPLPSQAVRVTPQPMMRVGGEIPVQATVNFPAKWFAPKAIVRITPVLHYAGRMQSGPTYTFQGEKVKDNYTVISKQDGGAQSFNFSFPYEEDMSKSELFLHMEADVKGKHFTFAPIKVGDGTITTLLWANAEGVTPAFAPDNFSRVVKEAYTTDIKFLIQRAEVRAQELRKTDVTEWRDVVENVAQTPNQEVSVEVQAYASPDGGVELNEKLSSAREKNTTAALKKVFAGEEIPMTAHYTSQDWEGFRELLEQSNIPDKELVLRVLSMYQDPEEREREIKNLSFVFKQLADEILPQLRRSRLVANVSIIGKSDDEIRLLAAQRPARLSIEELLYAATLTDKEAEKAEIYKYAAKAYPEDFRAYNNLGSIYLTKGDRNKASEWYGKAGRIKNNSYTNVNVALMAIESGRLNDAELILGASTDIPAADRAIGLLYLYQGKTEDAVQLMSPMPSRNTAVAQIILGRYADALKTLQALPEPDAVNFYLRAVIGARTNNLADVVENLKQAVRRQAAMGYKAADDLEFAAYRDAPEFLQIVGR